MSRSALKAIQAAAGAAGDPVYVDDVFSTFLYQGNSGTQTITNGIDLAGEGGLVWIKDRTNSLKHMLLDTVQGQVANSQAFLSSNSNGAADGAGNIITSFNNNGFSLGANNFSNFYGNDIVSWTFRKQPGFFDVVTWTGDGTNNRAISHSLGSTPGMLIIKRLDSSSPWTVFHRSLSSISNHHIFLDETTNESNGNALNGWSSTSFTIGTYNNVYYNGSGGTYVAYIFAHDAQDFGTNSDEAIIKCGGYTGNGSSTGPTIDLGFEPQWLMIKKSSGAAGWYMYDNMRGVATGGNDPLLYADATNSEAGSQNIVDFTSSGFQIVNADGDINANSASHIYMAIRRPHKPASELAAADLFKPFIYTGTSGTGTSAVIDAPTSPQAIDLAFFKSRQLNGRDWQVITRLISSPWPSSGTKSPKGLHFNTTDSEADLYSVKTFTGRDLGVSQDSSGNLNVNGESYAAWRFSRAPGFFDITTWTGTGSAQTVNHNLNAVPELIIAKSNTYNAVFNNWTVYSTTGTATKALYLDTADSLVESPNFWNDTTPTSSVFSVGSVNSRSSETHIAYLFASVAGISKVGSYTGTGNDINVNCGFTNGARFVMVKRTDSSGDWYVFDTARGIVAGNEGYLRFNLANDEDSADYIDPLSSGFTVTSSAPTGMNNNGGTYIFLAIA